VALPERALRRGEVALARLPDGSFALHRVLDERAGRVRLRGDAVVNDDPVLPRGSVLARADLMDAGAGVVPVRTRARLTLFALLRPLRRARLWWRARRAGRGRPREAHA